MMADHVAALKEALDYTRLYRDTTFVVKLGGEVLADEKLVHGIAMEVATLESLSIRVILVHGGGPQASELSRRLGIEPEIVAGRRVTSPEVLEVAKLVYAGKLNVDLLSALRAHGVRAVGLSGVDADLVTAQRRPPVAVQDDNGDERTVDFGEVGDITAVDPTVLNVLLPSGLVPVIASLAADRTGRALNVNADTLAAELAAALGAEKLIFMTGSPGLLADPNDLTSLVAFAGPAELESLLLRGSIRAGMRPKVEACMRAVARGVRRTHIIDGRVPDSLLVEVFTGHGSGTMIVAAKDAERYREEQA